MAKNPNNSTMSSFNYGSLKSSMNYSTLSLMSVNTSTNPTANRTFDFNTKDFVFCLTNKSMMANKDLMAAIKHLNPEYTLAETEDDLSHYAQERRKYYFVCDSFKGDLFKLLRKNSCRICAPTFLVYLYHKKRKIPETARPLFNGSMFGVAVCFTGFATKREAVSELADLVHYMGGSVRKDFSGKITHVVANLAQGQKYKAAVNLGKHIMTEEWVMQSWKHRDDMTFKATKPEFVEKYQMKPFYGLKLSFVGFSSEETKHMEELTLDNNGVYVDVGSEDCTHLVVEDTYTSSIPLEALKALHVVKQEWFWTSIQLDACAEESMYFHVSDLGTPLGTGSARLNKKKRKFLNASDLSDLLSPGSPFTSNKRQSKDGGLSMISSATFDSSLGSPFSASNIDSPAEQKEVIKTSLTKRHQTCFELQTTERNYVQVLRTIIKVFKEPIDESANQRGGPLLAAEEVKTIFGSIPDILEVHEKLLDQLDQLLNTWTEEHLIGKAIAECANGMMKTYPGFVNYFDMIKETIVTSDKEKPRFHAFLKVCLTKPDCGRQTLKELLIRPVQRLPSMCLLLKDILKHTSNDNPDHKHLKRAVAAVENVLAYINEDRRKTEHQVQMFEIIRDVDNCPPNILSSHRTLVSKVEGVEVLEGLVLKNDQLIMFLFNDSIEIAKKKSRGTGNNVVMKSPAIQNMRGNQQKAYKHVEFIQLSYLKSVVDIKSDEDEYKDMFGLIYHVPNENRDKLNIYKFTGGSCATKLDWMTIIVKCLAGTKCSNDMENFLVTVDASELLHDKNDLSESKERSASITKVFKKATGGFSKKVSRAFSLNKTPKKSQQDKSADPNLRRAMSSITPINEVGRLPSEVVSPTPSEYTMMDFSVCEEKMYLAYFCILFMLFTLTVCFPLDDYNGLPFMVNGRPKGGFLGKPCIKHAKTVDNLQSSEAQWFIQKLDHFKDSDSRTWQQKYYVNASYWKPNGPVFLMIGGEGPLSARWVSVGSMAENAVKFGAIMLALEHRFYGESHPLSDMSTENLQYLSSEQALADLAVFRQAMADQFSMTENNRWISFGGSYPGALSAWFRYKYPHLVYGAIASSAPIQAQLDFPQYLEVSTASLGSTECKTNVKKATASFESYTKTETGLKYLELKFKTCKSVAMNSNDIANFASIAAGNFFGVIQYNKDNREFEGAVGTNITVDVLCGIMNNVEIGDELDRYAYINTMMMKVYKQECLDTNYNDFIGAMKKTDWNSSAAEGGRQWLYQTCTEFGYYQTTDSDQQVFGSLFPLGFSTKQCVDIFGEQFNTTSINRGIDWTNSNYGGYAMKPTRVVFPNGSIDPWHALSFIENTKDIIAIYINGTAHCANMYPSSEDDSEELKAARQQVTSIISQWLIQPNTE